MITKLWNRKKDGSKKERKKKMAVRRKDMTRQIHMESRWHIGITSSGSGAGNPSSKHLSEQKFISLFISTSVLKLLTTQ